MLVAEGLNDGMLQELALVADGAVEIEFVSAAFPVYKIQIFDKWCKLELQHHQIFCSKFVHF